MRCVAAATLVFFGVSCSGAQGKFAATESPAPTRSPTLTPFSPTVSVAPRPICSSVPAKLDFVVGKRVAAAQESLIRIALTQARSYFKLHSDSCDPVTVTVNISASKDVSLTALASFPDTITVNVEFGQWLLATIPQRYKILFHEWYHLLQFDLSGGNLDVATWLSEGSAEWSGIYAAAHLGHYPSFAAARAEWIDVARTATMPLKSLEQGLPPNVGGVYQLSFAAVDYLVSKIGGQTALLKFWRSLGEGTPWESAFRSTFKKSLAQFYRDFEAYRNGGFAS